MLVFFLLLAMLGFAFFKRREGMTTDPSAMVQQQQGKIQKIKAQIDALTLTQSVVDQLQDLSDTNDDNTSTLQSNIGQTNTTALPNAYPDES
jgi:hypothetical protein